AELSEAIDAIPALSKELGADFPQCPYSNMVYHIVSAATATDAGPMSADLTRRYLTRQVEIQNYRHGMVAQALLRQLPTLKTEESRREALAWLTPLLEQYNTGGSGDFERMQLARWRNHLQMIISAAKTLGLNDLVDISLEPGTGQAGSKLHPNDL